MECIFKVSNILERKRSKIESVKSSSDKCCTNRRPKTGTIPSTKPSSVKPGHSRFPLQLIAPKPEEEQLTELCEFENHEYFSVSRPPTSVRNHRTSKVFHFVLIRVQIQSWLSNELVLSIKHLSDLEMKYISRFQRISLDIIC